MRPQEVEFRFVRSDRGTHVLAAVMDLLELRSVIGFAPPGARMIARARMLWRLRRTFDADLMRFRGWTNDELLDELGRRMMPEILDRMTRRIGEMIDAEIFPELATASVEATARALDLETLLRTLEENDDR